MRKDFGNMKKELEKNFNPAEAEDRIYAQWEKKGYFHAEVDEKKEPFTIVIPLRTLPVSSTWVTRWTRRFRIF